MIISYRATASKKLLQMTDSGMDGTHNWVNDKPRGMLKQFTKCMKMYSSSSDGILW